MRLSKRSFWTTGFVVASGFVFAATGCADDDDDNGSNAGTGGSSSGSGGKAGGAGGKAGSPTGGKAGSNQAGDGNEAGSTDIGSGGVAGEMPVGGAGGETPVGGAGGETAGGAPGEGGAGGAPAALDCAQYCDWMQASCTTAGNRQYPDDAQCLQSCAAFPTTVGANSFACRVGFAATVSTDATDCDAAGPAGIGECGTPCEAYCNLMLTYCSHEADGATLIACMTECGTVPQNNITTFVYPATGGDTLACRIAHATNAAKDTNPAGAMRLLHCDHAAGDEAPCLDATP